MIVAGVYTGSVEEGEPVVQPLRELGQPLIDLSGPWPWLGLQSGFDALFPKGELRYWKSRALAELPEEAIDEIADLACRRPTPLTDITIWHHGGAMSRVGEAETAYGGRDAPFLVTGEASWTDPAQTDEAIAWGREFWAAMGRHSTGGLYLNFPGLGEEKEELVTGGLRRQLRAARRAEGEVRPGEPLPHESQHHARGLSQGALAGPIGRRRFSPRRPTDGGVATNPEPPADTPLLVAELTP